MEGTPLAWLWVVLVFFAPALIAGIIMGLRLRSALAFGGTLLSGIGGAIVMVMASGLWRSLLAPTLTQGYQSFGGGLADLFMYLPLAAFLGVVAGSWWAVILQLRYQNLVRQAGGPFWGAYPLVSGLGTAAVGGLLATGLFWLLYTLTTRSWMPGGLLTIALYILASGLVGGTASAFAGGRIALWLL